MKKESDKGILLMKCYSLFESLSNALNWGGGGGASAKALTARIRDQLKVPGSSRDLDALLCYTLNLNPFRTKTPKYLFPR